MTDVIGPNDMLVELDDALIARLQAQAGPLGMAVEDCVSMILNREFGAESLAQATA